MFSIKTTIFSAFVLSMVSFVAAAPQGHHDPPSHVNRHIKYCVDENFAGACESPEFAPHQCTNLSKDFNDKISSFQPFDRQVQCVLYKDSNCSGDTYTVDGPHGVSNLKTVNFNDRISSYKCGLQGHQV